MACDSLDLGLLDGANHVQPCVTMLPIRENQTLVGLHIPFQDLAPFRLEK